MHAELSWTPYPSEQLETQRYWRSQVCHSKECSSRKQFFVAVSSCYVAGTGEVPAACCFIEDLLNRKHRFEVQ